MIKKIVLTILCLPILGAVALIVTGNSYIFTAIERTYLQGNTTANINDYPAFKTHQITTNVADELPKSSDYNKSALNQELLDAADQYGTAAYLVIKDGVVLSEHYFNGYDKRSKTNSFSMAKTVVTLLIGIAIEEGYIQSLEQKLTDFLPEFADDPLASNATIEQLSLMNSGYEWTEHYYSPFSPTVELLYGHDVEEFLLNGHFSAERGSYFEYSSASTQLLGIVLKRALEGKGNQQTISEFLSEKIWQPLQMNDNALWHTDDSGLELVFCCINTNARNFAKLGMLMLNKGQWDNQQLISADYIEKMITPVAAPHYGYSTWLNTIDSPSYYWFSGHLGQYIIVIPEHNMVVVRLGESRNINLPFREHQLPMLINQALNLADISTN